MVTTKTIEMADEKNNVLKLMKNMNILNIFKKGKKEKESRKDVPIKKQKPQVLQVQNIIENFRKLELEKSSEKKATTADQDEEFKIFTITIERTESQSSQDSGIEKDIEDDVFDRKRINYDDVSKSKDASENLTQNESKRATNELATASNDVRKESENQDKTKEPSEKNKGDDGICVSEVDTTDDVIKGIEGLKIEEETKEESKKTKKIQTCLVSRAPMRNRDQEHRKASTPYAPKPISVNRDLHSGGSIIENTNQPTLPNDTASQSSPEHFRRIQDNLDALSFALGPQTISSQTQTLIEQDILQGFYQIPNIDNFIDPTRSPNNAVNLHSNVHQNEKVISATQPLEEVVNREFMLNDIDATLQDFIQEFDVDVESDLIDLLNSMPDSPLKYQVTDDETENDASYLSQTEVDLEQMNSPQKVPERSFHQSARLDSSEVLNVVEGGDALRRVYLVPSPTMPVDHAISSDPSLYSPTDGFGYLISPTEGTQTIDMFNIDMFNQLPFSNQEYNLQPRPSEAGNENLHTPSMRNQPSPFSDIFSSSSSPLYSSDNERWQDIYPKMPTSVESVEKEDSNQSIDEKSPKRNSTTTTLKQFRDMQAVIVKSFTNKECCQTNRKSFMKFFQEKFDNLDEKVRISLQSRVASLEIMSSYAVLHHVLAALAAPLADTEDVHYSMFALLCELLLAKRPALFVDRQGLALLRSAVLRCSHRPQLTSYLVSCVRSVLRDNPQAVEGRHTVFGELESVGISLVSWCARNSDAHAPVLAELVRRGAGEMALFNLEQADEEGYTALHIACKEHSVLNPRLHTVHVLLEHGRMDLFKGDVKGDDTALHLAVNSAHCDQSLILLLFSTLPRKEWSKLAHTKNRSSCSPLNYARSAERSISRPNYPLQVKEFLTKLRNTKQTI